MEKLEKKSETIFDYIKNVIFKYCPLVEDRFYILDNAIKSPEMRIIIDFCNNETGILFMFGNGIHQSMIPESIKMDSCLDFIELKNIIQFILTDHEIIKNISNFNNRVELSFVINWSDKSKKGLSCNNIILEMNFESVELKNKYLYFIVNGKIKCRNSVNYFVGFPTFFIC